MAYELAPLPYAYNALEPHFDARTMEIHHGKHHQAYVNNTNAILKDHPALAAQPVDTLIANLSRVTEIEADLERHPGSASPAEQQGAQHAERQLADEAERFRRDVAERLARLVRPA